METSSRIELSADIVGARLDRLPMSRSMKIIFLLIAVGLWFEQFDAGFTGYIAPGLARAHIFTATTTSFFGMSGLASFIAAVNIGLLVGSYTCSVIGDRIGRRTLFTWALVGYSVCAAIVAFQTDPVMMNVWRFLSGIGAGLQVVTIDVYIAELAPCAVRGKANLLARVVNYTCPPIMGLLAWMLVDKSPLGFDGWRWVILAGSAGLIPIFWVARLLPESPRWLAQQGRFDEAETTLARIEANVERDIGHALPPPDAPSETDEGQGSFAELFSNAYRSRTIMLTVANLLQTIGYYGFVNWVPTLLIAKGIRITESLQYTFIMSLIYPLVPFLIMTIADKMERKSQIALSAVATGVVGLIFSQLDAPLWLTVVGAVQVVCTTMIAYSVHTYQAELYPTRLRGRGVGFVYAASRLSGFFTGFLVAYFLRDFGTSGVFAFIALAMGGLVLTVMAWGPRATGRSLEQISS